MEVDVDDDQDPADQAEYAYRRACDYADYATERHLLDEDGAAAHISHVIPEVDHLGPVDGVLGEVRPTTARSDVGVYWHTYLHGIDLSECC